MQAHTHRLNESWIRMVSQERFKDINFDRSSNFEEVWMSTDSVQSE